MLILHIGLPKTATTFLQHRVFPHVPNLTYLHRVRGPEAAAVCHDFRKFARAAAPLALGYRLRIAAGLRALAPSGPALVSDENISVLATGFWTGEGADPDRFAGRLGSAGGLPRPAKVIIGIRRQDQWLASRYAESSKHFPDFCQADFERRMAALTGAARLAGPFRWLDYRAVRQAFLAALGPGNVFVLPLERLAAAQDETLEALGDFLGSRDFLRASSNPGAGVPGKRRNSLSEGENLWRLKRDGTPLMLAPELEAALRARFAVSNRALAAEMALGFEP